MLMSRQHIGLKNGARSQSVHISSLIAQFAWMNCILPFRNAFISIEVCSNLILRLMLNILPKKRAVKYALDPVFNPDMCSEPTLIKGKLPDRETFSAQHTFRQ
jgi:hypothetical protein